MSKAAEQPHGAGIAKRSVSIAKKVFSEFDRDNCPTVAASLSYYAVFSLPPLMVIVITLAGLIFGEPAVEAQLIGLAERLIGQSAAEQVQTMLNETSLSSSGTGITIIVSIVALLFAATGLFVQLQAALNRAWEVRPDPDHSTVKVFLTKRLLSFGVIVSVVFLLMVSLVVSTAINAVGDRIAAVLPGSLSEQALYLFHLGISLIVFTLLFAAIFQWMPDARVHWRDVWIGAGMTALLFVIGRMLIGTYLGQSEIATRYGPAGALAVIMLWIYYASLIFLLGAEFTQVWARRYGERIRPQRGAVRVVSEERFERAD